MAEMNINDNYYLNNVSELLRSRPKIFLSPDRIVGSKSNTVSTFAQRQRPRSPVPAAIHERQENAAGDNYAEVTYVPVATAGPCRTNCQMVMPFMVLLFFMTLLVAVTQVQIITIENNR